MTADGWHGERRPDQSREAEESPPVSPFPSEPIWLTAKPTNPKIQAQTSDSPSGRPLDGKRATSGNRWSRLTDAQQAIVVIVATLVMGLAIGLCVTFLEDGHSSSYHTGYATGRSAYPWAIKTSNYAHDTPTIRAADVCAGLLESSTQKIESKQDWVQGCFDGFTAAAKAAADP